MTHNPGGANRREFLKAAAGAAAIGSVGSLAAGEARAAGGLVALVHTQAAGDAGPVDSMINALKKLSGEQGFEMRAIYAQDAATYESVFRSLADAGATVIVSTFNEVAEAFKALAPEYPNTKWIQIYGDAFNPTMPNVVTVEYDYYLGCYLSGMFAAKISNTGKIGYIGGISIPGLNADLNAIKAAVAATNPAATVTGAFAGSFQDPAKGHEIATQMYQDGIDYIQTDSAATDTGIIQAANEGQNRMVSAIDPAQYTIGPTTVAALVRLDFGQSLYNEVSKALGADFKGGHNKTGLGTGVIDFIMSPVWTEKGPPELVKKAQSVWPEIEKAKADIMSGSLKVPFNTTL